MKKNKTQTSKTETAKKGKKKKYKVRNWKEYNEMLVNRGRLIVHITDEAIKEWNEPHPTGKRGKPRLFSHVAIEISLTMQQCFRLPLRNTEGVVSEFLSKLNTSCKAPDYSTLSKRKKTLPVTIRTRPMSNEPLHLVADSSGIKVYGEGEWKVRQHGISKRRTWKKIHCGFDEKTGDIVCATITDNDTHDSTELPKLLDQIPLEQRIDQVSNDGGYDTKQCYEAIKKRGARAIIPPRIDAKIWVHGNSNAPAHQRDINLRRIREVGRAPWKIESGYHRRSMAENGFFRYKTIFGDKVSARTPESQQTELLLRCKILNRFTELGMPESYTAESYTESYAV